MRSANTSLEDDQKYLRRALGLARQSFGLASPNPNVGAVLVDAKGNIAGHGFHTYDGVKHAEVLALEQAGDKANGATLYINLEPCSHQGRTGPCADALIAAGVKRVVACTPDPNPIVSGRGFAQLRRAEVQVESGLLEEEARPLNDAFAKYIRYRLPLVTLKAAMTLDGKIAPPPDGIAGVHPSTTVGPTGGPTGGWITSEQARAHVQQLRHQHDAILVGVGTVIADNPLLTDRSGLPRRRPLLRVIVDSHLRLPLDSRVVQTAKNDVLATFGARNSG
jgi:diaminohydroxyphosphoribosylaminopyrimidine deaminase / 5-amino-6-(5-phosphoribosylamino)uracil reductase